MNYQLPPLGPCVFNDADGTWSGRRKLEGGTWVCLKPGCRRIHDDVPASQRKAAMEVREYMDDLNKHWQDEKKREKENQPSQR